MREFLVFMSWFSKPWSFGVDEFARTCVSALAALRMGVFWVCVDSDPTIKDPAWLRVQHYYRFLKTAGLLPDIGANPRPPTPWEVEGKHWIRKYGEILKLVRKSQVGKRVSEKMVNNRRRALLKSLGDDAVSNSGKKGILPGACPTKNYHNRTDIWTSAGDYVYEREEEMTLTDYLGVQKELNHLEIVVDEESGLRGLALLAPKKKGEIIGPYRGDLRARPDLASDRVVQLMTASNIFKKPIYLNCLENGWCLMSMVNDGSYGDLGEVNCMLQECDAKELVGRRGGNPKLGGDHGYRRVS